MKNNDILLSFLKADARSFCCPVTKAAFGSTQCREVGENHTKGKLLDGRNIMVTSVERL
jgi:hypothetical protein